MTGITRRAAIALLLSPIAARAHDGLHASGIGVAVHRTARIADDRIEAELTLTNTTGVAVTLRSVRCAEARSARLLQRSSLLGIESWSKVDLLRLDVSEVAALIRPDYVIEITGAPADEDLLNLTLDFGPAGERTTVLFVTD